MGNRKLVEETDEQLLIVGELALLLRRGVRTIWRLDKNQKIPAARKIGRAKRWSKKELDLWIKWGCPDRKKFNRLLKKERNGHDKTVHR